MAKVARRFHRPLGFPAMANLCVRRSARAIAARHRRTPRPLATLRAALGQFRLDRSHCGRRDRTVATARGLVDVRGDSRITRGARRGGPLRQRRSTRARGPITAQRAGHLPGDARRTERGDAGAVVARCRRVSRGPVANESRRAVRRRTVAAPTATRVTRSRVRRLCRQPRGVGRATSR